MGDSIKNQFVSSTLNNPVFNNAEKKIPKHLLPLPFSPEVFLGREDDLEEVQKKLFGRGNVLLLVNGEGGIGKTTFASKYYHRYAEEYAHMAWVFAEKSLADALLVLAVPLQLSFEETMPAEARLAELLKALAELEKPSLLVVDNANNLSDLERNYRALGKCPNFHVLLTTRITDLPNASFHPLGTLDREDARQLFCSYYRSHDSHEDGLLDQVLKAIGYNTLVIELLAKNIGHFNNRLKKRYLLSQLLADLTEKGMFGIPTQEVSTGYQAKDLGLRKETPEAILAAMYDLGELLKEERTVLSVLSVLPAETIGYELLEEIFSEQKELDRVLLGLSAKGWLEYNRENSTFKISPVVQEVVRRKNVDFLWEDCRTLLITLNHKLDYELGYGQLKNTGYGEATVWATYSEFAGSILLPWFQNHLPEEVGLVLLFDRLGSFYKTTGNLPKALLNFQTCEKLFIQLKDAYHQSLVLPINGLSIAYERLGTTHRSLGNLEKALRYFKKYNISQQKLYSSHSQNVSVKNGLATSYLKLGDTYSSLGNLEKEALGHFMQYNNLEQELHSSHPQNMEFKNGLAISFSRLGNTHSSLGNLKKALWHYKHYSDLEQQLYDSNPQNVTFKYNLAISYSQLGVTLKSLGNLKKALGYHKRSNILVQDLYSIHAQNVEFKNGLAISYERLGDIHELLRNKGGSLNNLKKALNYYERFNDLEQELYSSYPQNVEFKNNLAASYQFLGSLYENNLKENAKAKDYFKQAKSLFAELHASFPDFVEFKRRLAWTEDALRRVE